MFKTIRSRLVLSFATVALIAAIALGVVLLVVLQGYYSNLELTYLRGNAEAVSAVVLKLTAGNAAHDQIQAQIDNLAFLSQTRVRVFDASNALVYDSGLPQKQDVSLGVAKQALADSPLLSGSEEPTTGTIRILMIGGNGNVNFTASGSSSLDPNALPKGQALFYRSVQVAGSPFGFDLNAVANDTSARSDQIVKHSIVDSSGKDHGTVELSDGPAYGRDILASVASGWAIASAIAVLLAAVAGWGISRRISAPVLALTGATTLMAAGDLSSRADVRGQDEFGQLARSFNEMADQVEGTVSALRRFASDAAHELHTPLTALHTNLDLALESDQVEQRTFVERAQATVAQLERLTNDLLDLSRIEAKADKSPLEPIDLAELVRLNNETYASQAEQASLAFEMKVPTETVPVRVDATKAQRALSNLVDNACKFTPEGGVVKVELTRHGNLAVLVVADSGIGIPADDLPQLFNRFHRGRNATGFPGSGLGLAIVGAIAEQYGGSVSVENLSPGARFTLAWPLAV